MKAESRRQKTDKKCETDCSFGLHASAVDWKRGEYRFRRTRLLNVAARLGGEGSSPSSSAGTTGRAGQAQRLKRLMAILV
jgi:hypothetical protein